MHRGSLRQASLFVQLRRQTGRRVVLCGGFVDEKRAKKMRQDGDAEFINGSLAQSNTGVQVENLQNPAAFGTLAGVL